MLSSNLNRFCSLATWKNLAWTSLLLTLFIVHGRLLAQASATLATSQTADNGAGAFATGQYRNLFLETGHKNPEIATKINTAFQQLFHGDPSTHAVYYAAGKNANGPLAYITDIA
ncbi:MAG TPA: hypothetical protein VMU62_05055, partial [Acidobacteriaceae bacterium]|nr:hypothetical protein [Acidobacteriaceae bacterium]